MPTPPQSLISRSASLAISPTPRAPPLGTPTQGKDFVLIGQTCTGKSQKIANPIAQCLAEGTHFLVHRAQRLHTCRTM